MRGSLQENGMRNPTQMRIFHPSGQYNPRPTLSPQETALPPPDTEFLVQGLEPYMVYEFQVHAATNYWECLVYACYSDKARIAMELHQNIYFIDVP